MTEPTDRTSGAPDRRFFDWADERSKARLRGGIGFDLTPPFTLDDLPSKFPYSLDGQISVYSPLLDSVLTGKGSWSGTFAEADQNISASLGLAKNLGKRWSLDVNVGTQYGTDSGSKPALSVLGGVTQYNLMPDGEGVDLDYPLFSAMVGFQDLGQFQTSVSFNKPFRAIFPQVNFTYSNSRVDGKHWLAESDPDFSVFSDGSQAIPGNAYSHSGSLDGGVTFNPNYRMGQNVPYLAIKAHGGIEGGIDPREELGLEAAADYIGWHAGAKLMLSPTIRTPGGDDYVDLRDLVRTEVGGGASFLNIDILLLGHHSRYKDAAWTWTNPDTGDTIPDQTDEDYNISPPSRRAEMSHVGLDRDQVSLDILFGFNPLQFIKTRDGRPFPVSLALQDVGVSIGLTGENAGKPIFRAGVGLSIAAKLESRFVKEREKEEEDE